MATPSTPYRLPAPSVWPTAPGQIRPPWLSQDYSHLNDDYEPWYTQPSPSNRMLLSLRSGIDGEIEWALERLVRLARNEKFLLKSIPGLIDALFEWPDWYIEHANEASATEALFSPEPQHRAKRRRALESLLVLRNTALNDVNAKELVAHPRTRPLILNALHRLPHDQDFNMEFVQHVLDLLFAISSHVVLAPNTPPSANPIPSLEVIASTSQNRSMIIIALQTLTVILTNTANASHLSPISPALDASIRYLPLFKDKHLLSACLEYLYAHVSNLAMTRAFLLHRDMPGVLRLLMSLLITEQSQEVVTVEISGDPPTASAAMSASSYVTLSQEELDEVAAKEEPERSYDWMKAMFIPSEEGELTQVDFWTLYREAFTPYIEQKPLLVAAEVIKNVTVVFPQTQAMVLPGPPQRFVIKGIARKAIESQPENFKCLWAQSTCHAEGFDTPAALYEHVQGHLADLMGTERRCQWSTCTRTVDAHFLSRHVLTHLPLLNPPHPNPAQSDAITLSAATEEYPIAVPSARPLPAAPKTTMTYRMPKTGSEPPAASLTALLIIRVLFRTAFTSHDLAPRADEDHIGFPGVIEEDVEEEDRADMLKSDLEGERRGRQAFLAVRNLMMDIKFADPVLQDWMIEMVDQALGDNEEPL